MQAPAKNQVEQRLDNVVQRLDGIEVLVHQVLLNNENMDEKLNEKLDILQDDFEAQRRMIVSLKKSLGCQLTRRRVLDWILTIMCIVSLIYFYFYLHAMHRITSEEHR